MQRNITHAITNMKQFNVVSHQKYRSSLTYALCMSSDICLICWLRNHTWKFRTIWCTVACSYMREPQYNPQLRWQYHREIHLKQRNDDGEEAHECSCKNHRLCEDAWSSKHKSLEIKSRFKIICRLKKRHYTIRVNYTETDTIRTHKVCVTFYSSKLRQETWVHHFVQISHSIDFLISILVFDLHLNLVKN